MRIRPIGKVGNLGRHADLVHEGAGRSLAVSATRTSASPDVLERLKGKASVEPQTIVRQRGLHASARVSFGRFNVDPGTGSARMRWPIA
jgi:hypothetical protein